MWRTHRSSRRRRPRPEERQHPDREQDVVPSWERQAPVGKGRFPPNAIQDKTLSPPRDMSSLTFRTLRTERSWLARKRRCRTGWKSIEAAQNQTAIQQSGSRDAVGASQPSWEGRGLCRDRRAGGWGGRGEETGAHCFHCSVQFRLSAVSDFATP